MDHGHFIVGGDINSQITVFHAINGGTQASTLGNTGQVAVIVGRSHGQRNRHIRLPAKRHQVARRLQGALGENRGPVNIGLDTRQYMGAQHDASTLIPQFPQQAIEIGRRHRVQSHRGLIQHQQLRLAEQRLGQAKTLTHSLGIGLGAGVHGVRQPYLLQQHRHLLE